VNLRGGGGLFEPLGDAGFLVLGIGAAQIGAVDAAGGGEVGHMVTPETIRGIMPGSEPAEAALQAQSLQRV